ncbi:MAG: hypothetical protein HYW22_00490 [Candidatus Aenigmarchaeota archaeon]|nr:hypothetical protein [Candidatus Aenigmarchaeota archaeon]
MRLVRTILESLGKNWKWIVFGAVLYVLPALYRYFTTNSLVPILDYTLFLYQQNSQIIPVNLETLGALFLIQGSLGAIVGNSFFEMILKRKLEGTEKYLAYVLGSVSFALLWTGVQFVGYNFLNPVGPWGNSVFPSSNVYGRNILISLTVAPLLPYLIELLNRKIKLH